MEDLFEEKSSVDDQEVQDIRELISSFPILSKTRETSKCWQSIFTSMHQIINGTFLCNRDFDKSWFNKVCGKYDVFTMKFTWEELLNRTNAILNYVTSRKPDGFWYPRGDKISLSDFYLSQMKTGKFWSPFVELNFVDCITPQMFRKMFGPKICEKLDEILKDVWWTVDYDSKVKFYRGVDNLHDWFCNLSDDFVNRSDENHLVFGKFSSFLENIRQCNKQTGCIYPNFIGTSSPKWSVLIEWLKKNKKVEI